MKLLLDENTSHRILKLIEEQFPGSVHVNFADVPLRSDTLIWQYAKNNGFIIVTFDTDFVQIAALRGAPPYVVLLQLRNPAYVAIARLLIDRKQKIELFVADTGPDASAVLEINA